MYRISGLIGWNRALDEGVNTTKKICGSLVHRGSDDSWIWKDEINKIYFGHRPLSILDYPLWVNSQ